MTMKLPSIISDHPKSALWMIGWTLLSVGFGLYTGTWASGIALEGGGVLFLAFIHAVDSISP